VIIFLEFVGIQHFVITKLTKAKQPLESDLMLLQNEDNITSLGKTNLMQT